MRNDVWVVLGLIWTAVVVEIVALMEAFPLICSLSEKRMGSLPASTPFRYPKMELRDSRFSFATAESAFAETARHIEKVPAGSAECGNLCPLPLPGLPTLRWPNHAVPPNSKANGVALSGDAAARYRTS